MELLQEMWKLDSATTWWLLYELEAICLDMPTDDTTALLLCDSLEW